MKKYLKFGLVSFVFVVLGFAGVKVFAESINSGPGSLSSGNVSPMIVNIGPSGNVLLRGKIVSVGTDTINVKSWGGSWTVEVTPATKIMSPTKSLADFKADDIVGVMGEMSADGDFIINAKIVRAWGRRSDSDHDGIPDNQDNDDDNDGEDNRKDLRRHDFDNDGIVDSLDTDDDGDGVLDTTDSMPSDRDNDGIPDFRKRHGRNLLELLRNRDHDSDDDDDTDKEDDDSNSNSGGSN
ncbi:MAG: hypothetical protein AAB786_00065 [Patescibacteria group bacterium]